MAIKIPHIIIADDHDLFRDGISTLFKLSGIAEVIAEASNGLELLEKLEHFAPEIILMDIDMPIMNGIDATREAIKRFPNLKILALSMFGEHKYYYQMIEAGAKGFLLKTANKSELEDAVKMVAKGQNYFSSELLQEMIAEKHPSDKESTDKEAIRFSEKEIDILNHMGKGFSNDEISEHVFLSPKTIANYRNIMLTKTECKNSTHLIFYAIQHNIIKV